MLGIPSGPELDHPGSILAPRRRHPRHARDPDGAGRLVPLDPHLVARLPDHELWMAFFDDTEGNVLALMAEVRS